MAATAGFGLVEAREGALVDLGYLRHTNEMTDRPLHARFTQGRRTHLLHVVAADTWPTRNQRLLRDYLRTHPGEAERYATLKRSLATAGTHPGDYARAKTALVQELTDRARAERGPPTGAGWEKNSR